MKMRQSLGTLARTYQIAVTRHKFNSLRYCDGINDLWSYPPTAMSGTTSVTAKGVASDPPGEGVPATPMSKASK
jgi:hypothetical protein